MKNFTKRLLASTANPFGVSLSKTVFLILCVCALMLNSTPIWAALIPTVQANKAVVVSYTAGSATLSVSGGDGSLRLVVIRESVTAAVAPTDDVAYTPSLVYGSGSTTGLGNGTGLDNGNYVVKADASTADFVVSGLPANKTFYVNVYTYNQDAVAPKEHYLTTLVSTAGFVSTAGTYVFSGLAANDNWRESTNWAPNRIYTVTSADIIIFDGVVTPDASTTIDFGKGSASITETVGQTRFINNVRATLIAPTNGNAAGILQMSGDLAGVDFVVESGATCILYSNASTTNRYIVIKLTSNQTAAISGTLTFVTNSNTTSVPHRLLGASAGSIQFLTGSIFDGIAVVGYPFGTTFSNTLGTTTSDFISAPSPIVVFNTGSIFKQKSGLDPFSPGPDELLSPGSGNNPVTSFLSGSSYVYSGGTFSNIGHTYGNLQFLLSPATVAGTTKSMVIANDLTVGDGTVTNVAVALNTATSPAAGVSIGGDITVNTVLGNTPPNALSFNPTPLSTVPSSTVLLNGSTAQTIGGNTAPTFGAKAILELNNTSTIGVTLQVPVTVPDGIKFTNGLLNTTPINVLNLPTAATVTPAGGAITNTTVTNTSFVNGPVTRTTEAVTVIVSSVMATGTGLFFPIGTAGKYRPITLELNQTVALNQNVILATRYTGRVVSGAAPAQTFPDPVPAGNIRRISGIRYYEVGTNGASAFTNGVIAIYYGADDKVDAPSKLRIAKSQSVSGVWANLGGGSISPADGTIARDGSITSSSSLTANAPDAPFSSLGNFTLASIVATSNPGNNPLPVELSRFSATANLGNVTLDWATASEKNNDRFDVQCSATGSAFKTIGSVKGQDNSTTAHDYTFVDSRPLAGLSYYRLRQVNTDGSSDYSPVATVQSAAGQKTIAFPNPSTGTITLPALDGPIQYRIYNNVGQTLLSGQAIGNEQLDITKISRGTFFLELTSQSGRTTQRLMRE